MQSTVAITPLIRDGSGERIVFDHLLYGAWPDHGVPEEHVEERLHLVPDLDPLGWILQDFHREKLPSTLWKIG